MTRDVSPAGKFALASSALAYAFWMSSQQSERSCQIWTL
jgi:hypothetical protein